MSQTEVQLIKDAVIVNADVSNSAAIDVSKISGALPAAGGTITGDVTFDGETAGRDIVFDRSDNALEFLDDAKATFGTGADCSLVHSGADFAITNSTGNLNILCNSSQAINLRHGSENMIRAITDGAVELYYDNVKKFETNSDGGQIFSTLEIGNTAAPFLLESTTSGNGQEDIGRIGVNRTNSSTSDRQMWLQYTVGASASQAAFQARSANDTGTAGTYLKIDAVNNNVDLPRDNEKLQLGAGNDLQLYHNGTRSEIINNTGDLIIQTSANNELMLRAQTGESHFIGYHNAQVELYYDGSKKFETRSNGVEINGHLSLADNNEIRLGNVGSNGDTRITHVAGSHTEINHVGTGDLVIETVNGGDDIMLDSNDDVFIKHNGESMAEFRSDAEVNLYYDNVKTFATQTNGIASFGGEGNDAYVYLFADEGDDNADQWRLQALAASSKLEFRNREDGNYRINAEMVGGGHVKLYNDNSQRFATFSGGTVTYGQVRQAQTNGNTRTMKTVVTNGLASGETLSFQDTSLNFHGFGEVTVILKHNSTSTQATCKKFPISIRSTGNAGLGSEIYSIQAATAGQSMTVTGIDRGVNVRNNEAHSCTCTVILDLIIMA